MADLMGDNGKPSSNRLPTVFQPSSNRLRIGPPPVGTEPPQMAVHGFGIPVMAWEYRDVDGSTLFWIARYEVDGKKTIRPWSWDLDRMAWAMRAYQAPRPLYGLDLLAKRPDEPVLVVEGEKAAEAAKSLGYLAVTWPGGAEAVKYADFSPLSGRNVVIWPDADDPGRKAAQGVAQELSRLGESTTASIVSWDRVLEAFPCQIREGHDIADLVSDGLDHAKTDTILAGALPYGNLAHLGVDATPPPASTTLTPAQLAVYVTDPDPNTLLGRRWLCKAGACLLVGQTGLGKSSLVMQAASTWGLGKPFFGIAPVRPLKSLIIQAENDPGDLAEMFRGVANGIGLDVAKIDPFMTFVTNSVDAGPDRFIPMARDLIDQHKPDLVWIDPLFSYLGGNASDQAVVSPFLRNGLGAIAQETGVAWIVVHHTPKPPRDPSTWAGADFSYAGAGSAELANWARAILVLEQADKRTFRLRAPKRGKRSGFVNDDGEQSTETYLQHASHGIHWERALEPSEEREESEAVASVVAKCIGNADKEHVREAVVAVLQLKNPRSVYRKNSFARRVWEAASDEANICSEKAKESTQST